MQREQIYKAYAKYIQMYSTRYRLEPTAWAVQCRRMCSRALHSSSSIKSVWNQDNWLSLDGIQKDIDQAHDKILQLCFLRYKYTVTWLYKYQFCNLLFAYSTFSVLLVCSGTHSNTFIRNQTCALYKIYSVIMAFRIRISRRPERQYNGLGTCLAHS